MTEARYRGQKVVVVSPDYAEHTKFADHWLAAQPGSDAAPLVHAWSIPLQDIGRPYVLYRRRYSTVG